MGDELGNYCLRLIDEVPRGIYLILIVFFCLGTVITIGLKGIKNVARYSMGLLLLEYIFLLYATTVIHRDTMRELKYNFTPFWSYIEIADGDTAGLLSENIMNVVAFVPVGLLLGLVLTYGKIYDVKWKKGLLISFLLGVGLSVGIESLQFTFKKGFAEMDDVMHNTIGCLVGYGIIYSMKTRRRHSETI